MSEAVDIEQDFGCGICWPSSPESAWEAVSQLSITEFLIDEPHFIVSRRHCPACQQAFVSVMTETIDWMDGEDPQYRTVMPLLEQEANDLAGTSNDIESKLRTLAPQRRSLKMDFPKGEPQKMYWSHGISVGVHD